MNKRKLLKYHSVVGFVLGVFLLIQGLSGVILLFHYNIETAIFNNSSTFSEVHSQPINIDKGVSSVQKKYPNWDIRLARFGKSENLVFRIRHYIDKKIIIVAPDTGKIIKELNENNIVTKIFLKMHYSLYAGLFGKFIILLVGLLFIFSIISGLFLYKSEIKKALFFKLRKNKPLYIKLHIYVGAWALIFNILIAITGVFLAYEVLMADINSGKNNKVSTCKVVTRCSIDHTLNRLEVKLSDFSPTYIRFPKKSSDPIVINGKFKEDPFYYSHFYNKVLINPISGEIISIKQIRRGSVLDKIKSIAFALHSGQYGGWIIKILYCIFGLSGPILSVTGFLIWLTKKHTYNFKFF